MPKILIVDDSPIDRQLVRRLLEKGADVFSVGGEDDLKVVEAENGQMGLQKLGQEHFDAVLTDLNMPVMNGLEMVELAKVKYPLIPVILMTANGSEEIAIQALRSGAASYVPKQKLADDLVYTTSSVIESSQAKRDQSRLMNCIASTEAHFTLDNDPALIPPLIGYLKESRFRVSGSDETGLVQLTIALREAVLNAMHHGNLELSSELRENDESIYHKLAKERKDQKPYSDRRVTVIAKDSPIESVYIIRDEGPGFDATKLSDPTDPSNMDKVSGRGLLLIRTFMDEVRHNARGNEITMVKKVGGNSLLD